MSKVKEVVAAYTILEANSVIELIDKVHCLLNEDYEPTGGVIVTHEHKDDKDFTGHTVFLQPMIKKVWKLF